MISVPLLYFFRYNFEQDVISYLSIAEKYYKNDWIHAVNGVWGPLISWLLIPFYFFNFDHLLSFKLLQIFIGFFTLNIVAQLLELFEIHKPFKYYLLISSIWIIVLYVYLTGTPDLLLACIMLYLLLVLLGARRSIFKFSIITGVIGALMYFAKPFGFPLFLALFIGYYLLNIRGKSKVLKVNELKYIGLGLVVFLLLVVPWIYALSTKYDRITFSTGGEYNFAIVGPQYSGVHLPRMEKLYEPVNETATSYWEDPTFLIADNWNPFGSVENFLHLVKIISNNLVQALIIFLKFSPLLILLFIVGNNKLILSNWSVKVLLFACVINTIGLLLLFIEQRYLIAIEFILLVITAIYTQNYLGKINFSHRFKQIINIIVSISLSFAPIYSLIKHSRYGEDLKNVAIYSKENLGINGNIASLSHNPLDEDWGSTIAISYLLNSRYYGEVNRKYDDDKIYLELKSFNISYLFVWDMYPVFSKRFFSEIYRNDVTLYNSILKHSHKKLIIYKVL